MIQKSLATKERKECWTLLLENLIKLAQEAKLWLAVVLALREHTKTSRSFFAQRGDRPVAERILLVILAWGSPYSITERRVSELIPVLVSQPAGDVSHKPGGRLPLLSARPAVTLATPKRVATNFAAWWTEARWVWTVYLRLLPDSVATAIWTRALLRLSPAR